MAKTPLKRRRAASPPPRKQTRASRPTRKGGSPYQSNEAFAERAGRADRLLHPLTADKEEDIRVSFRTQRQQDAEQLLRDWGHVGKEAYRTALTDYMWAERKRVLFRGRAGQQRNTRLEKATVAATEAIEAVKKMVANWRPELGPNDRVMLTQWSESMTSELTQQREAIERYRARAGK